MISYFDLQDASGAAVRFHGDGQPNRGVTNTDGLPGVTGFQGPRDSVYNKPWAHGAVSRTKFQKSGLITVEGFVRGNDGDGVVVALDDLKAAALDALDTPRLLLWRRGPSGSGQELQSLVRLASDFNAKPDGPTVLRYQVSFRADDPRGYSQTLQAVFGGSLASGGGAIIPRTFTVTFDQGASGAVAVTNTGTRPSPPVIRMFGMAVNPRVLLLGTDLQISIVGTIGAGDYLELDIAARTARLNGTSPAQFMVDAGATRWFEIPRGSSTLRMLALSNDAGARADVLFRNAFA